SAPAVREFWARGRSSPRPELLLARELGAKVDELSRGPQRNCIAVLVQRAFELSAQIPDPRFSSDGMRHEGPVTRHDRECRAVMLELRVELTGGHQRHL